MAAKGSSARLFRQNVPCNVPHPQEIPIPSVGGWGGGVLEEGMDISWNCAMHLLALFLVFSSP